MRNKFDVIVICTVFIFCTAVIVFYENNKINNLSNNIPKIETIHSLRLDKLEMDMQTITQVLISINSKIERFTDDDTMVNNKPEENNASTSAELQSLSSYQEQMAEIISSLVSRTVNYASLISSDGYRRLPIDMKKQVMDEVTRMLDSGELSKEAFLPGYKAL